MLTRGYLIGEVVDDLANLAGQVRMRNAIHLFDLTVTTENFFRDVLNILMRANFRNLNAQRSNEPGLDLGDEVLKIGVQVTSSANSAKVTNTLMKISDDNAKKFKKIIVLGLNKRQQSYSFDTELATKYSFSTDDIWDLDTLARLTIDLEIDQLHALYNLVRTDSARLKFELEVPDETGKYPTSGYDMWEKPPVLKVGDGTTFQKYMEDLADPPDLQRIQEAIAELSIGLSRLPRVTREFLVMLLEQREAGRSARFNRDGWEHLLLAKVQRQYRGEDLDGELDILKHAGFVEIEGYEPHEYGGAEIGVCIPSSLKDLQLCFVSFVKDQRLSFRSVIGAVDLSGF